MLLKWPKKALEFWQKKLSRRKGNRRCPCTLALNLLIPVSGSRPFSISEGNLSLIAPVEQCSESGIHVKGDEFIRNVAVDMFDQNSASVFSPEHVRLLLKMWLPPLSHDLNGVELHEATRAAFMVTKQERFCAQSKTIIYTDGSGGASGHACCPTWAFVVLQERGDEIVYVGSFAGQLVYDPAHPCYLGAVKDADNDSFAAEISALVWACIWWIQSQSSSVVEF